MLASDTSKAEGIGSNSSYIRPEQQQLRLLIIEDDPFILAASSAIADQLGFDVDPVNSLADARTAIRERNIDLVLLDVHLGKENGLALLDEVRAQSAIPVVVTTAFATVGSAIAALRAEAFDFVEKPFSVEQLGTVLRGAASEAIQNRRKDSSLEQLIPAMEVAILVGCSPLTKRLRRMAYRVASGSHPVFIHGEPGTQKRKLAEFIHINGTAPSAPFVSLDCSTLSEDELQRSLFGYSPGHEHTSKRCRCSAAGKTNRGTLFLNEVDQLPLRLQAALLKALDSNGKRSPFSAEMVPITTRIIAASSNRIETLLDSGGFRRDLFLRLNVVSLHIPPLREHKIDIPELCTVFLGRLSLASARPRTLARNVLRQLMDYDWPGNLTELENVLESTCLISDGGEIQFSDLPNHIQRATALAIPLPHPGVGDYVGQGGTATHRSLACQEVVHSMADIERNAIVNAISQTNGNKLLAAEVLGIGKTTLYRKLKEYAAADRISKVRTNTHNIDAVE